MNNKEIKYIKVNITGCLAEGQDKLEIYKWLKPYKLGSHGKQQKYIDDDQKVFQKELAIEMLFKYFHGDKEAMVIADEEKFFDEPSFGSYHGNTRVYCGLDIKSNDHNLKVFSPEEAKRLITELVEFVYK